MDAVAGEASQDAGAAKEVPEADDKGDWETVEMLSCLRDKSAEEWSDSDGVSEADRCSGAVCEETAYCR